MKSRRWIRSGCCGWRSLIAQSAWLAEAATQVAGDIITANPSINVIYACNDGGTVGATMAVKNAGKAGKIVVFGIDGNEQLANFMLSPDNILQATTAQQATFCGIVAGSILSSVSLSVWCQSK